VKLLLNKSLLELTLTQHFIYKIFIMAYMNVLKFHSGQLPPMNCRIVLSTGSNGEEKSAFSCGEVISGELHISCQKDIYSFGEFLMNFLTAKLLSPYPFKLHTTI